MANKPLTKQDIISRYEAALKLLEGHSISEGDNQWLRRTITLTLNYMKGKPEEEGGLSGRFRLKDIIQALEYKNDLGTICKFLQDNNVADADSIMSAVKQLHKSANLISKASSALRLDQKTFSHVNKESANLLGDLQENTLNQISQWLYQKNYDSIADYQKNVILEGVSHAFKYMVQNGFAQKNANELGPNSTLLLAELSCVFAILGNRNGKDLSNIAFSGFQKTDDVEINALNALNVLFDEDGGFNEKFFEPQIYIDGKKSSISNRGKSRWAKLLTRVRGEYKLQRPEETQEGAGEETREGAGEETREGAGEETREGAGEKTQQSPKPEQQTPEQKLRDVIMNWIPGINEELANEIINSIPSDQKDSLVSFFESLSNKNISEILDASINGMKLDGTDLKPEYIDNQLTNLFNAVLSALEAVKARTKTRPPLLDISKFIKFIKEDLRSSDRMWYDSICKIADYLLNGGHSSTDKMKPTYLTEENVTNALRPLEGRVKGGGLFKKDTMEQLTTLIMYQSYNQLVKYIDNTKKDKNIHAGELLLRIYEDKYN
ncbi:MAG: hypothetical protein QXN01_03270, partial [Candidatus Anstonellales archaeon]